MKKYDEAPFGPPIPRGLTKKQLQKFLHYLALFPNGPYQMVPAIHPDTHKLTLLYLARKSNHYGETWPVLESLAKREDLADEAAIALVNRKNNIVIDHLLGRRKLSDPLADIIIEIERHKQTGHLILARMAVGKNISVKILCQLAKMYDWWDIARPIAGESPLICDEVIDTILSRPDIVGHSTSGEVSNYCWTLMCLAENRKVGMLPENIQLRIIMEGRSQKGKYPLRRLAERNDLTETAVRLLAKEGRSVVAALMKNKRIAPALKEEIGLNCSA